MPLVPLSSDEINKTIQPLSGWMYANDTLIKEFVFSDFKEALSFIVRVGLVAETQNHHPELFNVYNRVELQFRTHDAGNKVTQKDLNIVKTIESWSWGK